MRWRSAGMSRLTSSRWSGLVVGVILVAALTGINILLDPRVPAQYLLVLYVLPVMAVAIGWGTRLAVVTAVLSATAFHYFFVDSHFTLVLEDLSNVVRLARFPRHGGRRGTAGGAIAAGGRWSRRDCQRSNPRCGGSRHWSRSRPRHRRSSRPSPERSVCCAALISRAWSVMKTTER